jgi:hypothetical protein
VTSIDYPLKIWSSKRISRKKIPNIDQSRNTAHQNSSLEIIKNETFNEEESFSFQSIVFDRESNKLIIEKGDVKNKKGKSRSKVDLSIYAAFPDF